MAEDVYSFGAWVCLRRQSLVMSREDLARQVGVAEVSIRKIEADERRPSPQVAALLAQQLQLAAETHTRFVQVARGLLAVDQLPPPIPGGTGPAAAAPATTPAPALLPSGTVTFLFTDIAGSTRLWEQHPTAMAAALARHDALLQQAVGASGGLIFKTGGDAICAAFARAPDALNAALAAQRALQAEPWDATGPLRVRIALHTGVAEERAGDYFGPALNRVARLLAAGHGGQILLSLATEQLVREHLPPDTALRDLGMHRLKDLSYPEQIFQLVAPDLPTDFPQLNTLNARRTNLPIQPTALIGREQAVAMVCALLRRDDVRLLTLTGPGGTGKTRLGLQVAAELLDAFVDGVYFVNLAPISDPALITSTIMQALGITETGDQSAQERLQSYLRDKQLLLLLDNFEQIVDAAPVLAELLAGCPQLTLLVTSRVPLHLRGEKEIAVPPLALPPNLPLSRGWERGPGGEGDLTQYAAVQLFIQRALDIQPSFAVTNANAPAVAEICHRLDGLPLAIELAAARVKLFAPEALLARLRNRLALLTGGARDLPARQQTLRSAIAWSYDLLEPSEQTLFTQLGVFVGGCALEAAEAVCAQLKIENEKLKNDHHQHVSILNSQFSILDGLELLVDSSLLLRVDGADGEPRFVMLETIREYALERLEASGAAEMVRQRHATYYLMLAETAEPLLQGWEAETWLARLERDFDNLRAALKWTLDQSAPELAIRMSAALHEFWFVYSRWNEGLRWLEAALAAGAICEPPVAVAVRAKALVAASHLLEEMGDRKRARLLLNEALTLYQELKDTRGIILTNIALQQEDVAAAIAALQAALPVFRELEDQQNIAGALNDLGRLAIGQGNYSAARVWLDESLAIERQLGYKMGMASVLLPLGWLAFHEGDYALMRVWNEERLALEQSLGNAHGIGHSLYELGVATFWLGDIGQATASFETSLALFRKVAVKNSIARALDALGHLALAQADYEAARTCFEECLVLRREQGRTEDIAWSLHWVGQAAAVQGDDIRAAALLEESLALFQDLQDQRGLTYVIEGTAERALAHGQPERAARLCGAVAAVREAISSRHSFPDERVREERLIAAARAQLEAATFDAAWAAGAALTLEQAIAYALGEDDGGTMP